MFILGYTEFVFLLRKHQWSPVQSFYLIKQTEFFEIMLPLSEKNGSVTTVHLVSLFYTNDAVFASTGCFLIAVFGCVSTHLENEKQQ